MLALNFRLSGIAGSASVIEHTVVTAQNYAYITIKGSPDFEDFVRAARAFRSDPSYSAKLHRICDFSQADMSHIRMENFLRFIDFAIREITLAPDTRVALIAPDRDRMGILEQFALNIESGVFKIFTDTADAMDWVES